MAAPTTTKQSDDHASFHRMLERRDAIERQAAEERRAWRAMFEERRRIELLADEAMTIRVLGLFEAHELLYGDEVPR